MVDIPNVIKTKIKHDARKRVEELQLITAAGGRALEQEDYKSFVSTLMKAADIKTETKFNRNKFEQLRSLTSNGGNRT